MAERILIKDALIINDGVEIKGSVLVEGGLITRIFQKEIPEDIIQSSVIIDASDKLLLPGIIDDQVHFREPGLTYKGDIYTEAKAAVAGGVTSFMEMPNTNPQTITQELLEEKYNIASQRSLANYSFYIGATNDNLDELLKTDPQSVCGIKIFMGSSTGKMLVDSLEALNRIFEQSPLLIAVHCEDEQTIQANTKRFFDQYGEKVPVSAHPLIRSEEACYKSSALAVSLARKYGTRLHVLHLSTGREMQLFSNQIPLKDKRITSEVCVHHLWFDDRDYERLGNRIKWNPAIKTQSDKERLLESVLDDTIDVIATDHAPHSLEEKGNTYFKAPSGGPLVQHSLNVMHELHCQGKISLTKVAQKMCHHPADIFKVYKRGYIREGYFADLVLFDPKQKWTVSADNILYKCKWSPFEGYTFSGKVTHTFVNGKLVYENGLFNESTKGTRLKFER